jgi:hypothetical protein
MPYQLVNVVVSHLFADSLRRKWSTLIGYFGKFTQFPYIDNSNLKSVHKRTRRKYKVLGNLVTLCLGKSLVYDEVFL